MFDRDKAREVLLWPGDPSLEATLDALAACVVDTPHTIDRDALERVLNGWFPTAIAPFVPKLAEQILALVQPAEITLTPEEAQRLLGWYAALPVGITSEDVAIADRLKAAM